MTEIRILQRIKKNYRTDIGKQGNLVLAFILILFLYFGSIANAYSRDLTEFQIIWLYQLYFEKLFGLPIMIILFTSCYLVYSEDLYFIGIKKALWLVPYIVILSIIWYFILFEFSLQQPLLLLFGHIQGYFHFFILYATILIGAFGGKFIKIFIEKRKDD